MAINPTPLGAAMHAALTASGRSSSPQAPADQQAVAAAISTAVDAELPPLTTLRRVDGRGQRRGG